MEEKDKSIYSAPIAEIVCLRLTNSVLQVSGGGHTNPGDDPDPLDD